MRSIPTVLEFLKVSGCEKQMRDYSRLVVRISKLSSNYSEIIFWKKKNKSKIVKIQQLFTCCFSYTFVFNYPVFYNCKIQAKERKLTKIIYLHVGKVSQGSEHSPLDVCDFNAFQAAVKIFFSVKGHRNSVVKTQILWAFSCDFMVIGN